MLSLTKKQVKSLLEVISSDDVRPLLQQAKIDTFNDKPVLVATDSYKLVALELSDNMTEFAGKMIDRAEIVKWYKLASAKDLFTEADLIDLPTSDVAGEYPLWQKLIPEPKNFSAVAQIGLNASYLMTLQTLADVPGLTLEFYGKMSPVTARKGGDLYLIMPLKV